MSYELLLWLLILIPAFGGISLRAHAFAKSSVCCYVYRRL